MTKGGAASFGRTVAKGMTKLLFFIFFTLAVPCSPCHASQGVSPLAIRRAYETKKIYF